MIRFIRTSKYQAFGKDEEYTSWVKEMRTLLRTMVPSGNVDVFFNRFGELATIHWMIDFEDLAELDKFQMEEVPDEYMKLSKKWIEMGVNIPGTTTDTILTLLEED